MDSVKQSPPPQSVSSHQHSVIAIKKKNQVVEIPISKALPIELTNTLALKDSRSQSFIVNIMDYP